MRPARRPARARRSAPALVDRAPRTGRRRLLAVTSQPASQPARYRITTSRLPVSRTIYAISPVTKFRFVLFSVFKLRRNVHSHLQPDMSHAVAGPLERVPAVSSANAAGFPVEFVDSHQRAPGECRCDFGRV